MKNLTELIRRDLVVVNVYTGDSINYDEIVNRKNYFKQKLDKVLNHQTVGKTVYLNHNDFDWVVPIVMAIWESGCNIFLHELNAGFNEIPEFSDFYSFIDVTVNLSPLGAVKFSDKSIDHYDYTSQVTYFDNVVTFESADTIAVKAHTSGTTGRPKIINFTHKELINRVHINLPFYNYGDNPKPFHFKTLHHGALLCDYTLPLLASSQEHHFLPSRNAKLSGDNYNAKNFLNLVLPYIAQHEITTIMMPYEWINYFDLVEPIAMQHSLSIRTLRGYDARIAAWIFENIQPNDISNHFGCSELGTMFIARVTKDNYRDYVPNLFTHRCPDLECTFDTNLMQARHAGYDTHVLADKFVEQDGKLYYHGRSYAFTVDNEQIFVHDLENYLRSIYHPTKFQIVPDFLNQKLYLALFDPELDTDLNKINDLITANVSAKHCLQDVRYFRLQDVNVGIKPSGPILLYAFTKDNNDIQSH
jgi:AMP-binding enzyme